MPTDYELVRNNRKLGPAPKHHMGESPIPMPKLNPPQATDRPAHPEDISRPAFTGVIKT